MAKYHPLEGYFRQTGHVPDDAYKLARAHIGLQAAMYVKLIMMGILIVERIIMMTPLRDSIFTMDGLTTIRRMSYGLIGGALISLYFVVKARSIGLWIGYTLVCMCVLGLALI